tara:strand:+ start:996 stop:1529 length:534 start_codon:yes stop_codon:yes gene_type:complete
MKTVIVSGGFDPLHEGHIELLARSRMVGDRLVVLLNSDEWLVRKKGYALLPFKTRQAVLRANRAVDWVQGFDDQHDNAVEGLGDIRFAPQPMYKLEDHTFVFANGGDRNSANTPEVDWCGANGVGVLFNVGDKVAASSDFMRPWHLAMLDIKEWDDDTYHLHEKLVDAALKWIQREK